MYQRVNLVYKLTLENVACVFAFLVADTKITCYDFAICANSLVDSFPYKYVMFMITKVQSCKL